MSFDHKNPDDDRSYKHRRAWRNTKLAFGWKPDVGRKDTSYLITALLNLEDFAIKDRWCIRLALEIAIRSFLRLNDAQKDAAMSATFREHERESAAASFDNDLEKFMAKAIAMPLPVDDPAPDESRERVTRLLPETLEVGELSFDVVVVPGLAVKGLRRKCVIDYTRNEVQISDTVPGDDYADLLARVRQMANDKQEGTA